MSKHTDRAIIRRALELLTAGLLPSVLPARLMAEFRIDSDRARRLAGRAVEERKREKSVK